MDNIQELAEEVLKRDGLDNTKLVQIRQKLLQWTSSQLRGEPLDYRQYCSGKPSAGLSDNSLILSQRLLRKKTRPLSIFGPDLIQAASAALYLHEAGFKVVSLHRAHDTLSPKF
jgi:hypothetical protein